MRHLPIFLEIKDRLVVVAGGGEPAARKAEILVRAGGRVRVVATELCPALAELADGGGIEWVARDFTDTDLDGCTLVFSATGDEDEDARISSLARDAGLPVNVVDRLSLSSFIMPSLVDRSPVLIAVSSGGEAPILSRILRARLETFVPAGLGRLAGFAGACRQRVMDAIPDGIRRRRFWESLIHGPIA